MGLAVSNFKAVPTSALDVFRKEGKLAHLERERR